jgi:hypothetical protein
MATADVPRHDGRPQRILVWACSVGDLEGLRVCRNKRVSFVVFEKQPGTPS